MSTSLMDRIKARKIRKANKPVVEKTSDLDSGPIGQIMEDEYDLVDIGGMDMSRAELLGLTEAMGG